MAKLVEIKDENLKDEWTVTVQGATWEGFASETDYVTSDKLQADSHYFKGLILVNAFYDYGFMDNSDMDHNISNLADKISKRFNVTPYYENSDDMYNTFHDFVCDWIPYDGDGYGRDYPYDDIEVDIKDSNGRKYALDYDEADVIDALKAYNFIK